MQDTVTTDVCHADKQRSYTATYLWQKQRGLSRGKETELVTDSFSSPGHFLDSINEAIICSVVLKQKHS